MADQMTLKFGENLLSSGTQNDVVSMQQTIMETAEIPFDGAGSGGSSISSSGGGFADALCMDENVVFMCATHTQEANSHVDGSGSSGSGCDGDSVCVAVGDVVSAANLNATNGGAGTHLAKNKGKRRRRKSKQKTNNVKPFKKSNWKFQIAPRPPQQTSVQRQIRVDDGSGASVGLSTLVPYNTNKFLMEEHMPVLPANGVRTRDSSFSIDDSEENNYFNALPEDEEEFLTKEFSSVYEVARSERLDGMSKSQLIREYLQMEANYDKLSQNLGDRKCDDDNANEQQQAQNYERENIICRLEDRVKELAAENLGKFKQISAPFHVSHKF